MLIERFYSKKRVFSKGFCKSNYQKFLRSDGSGGCETRWNFFMTGGIFNIKPIYLNFFENPATVQFNHRLLGFLTFLAAILLFVYSKKCKLHKQIQKKMVLIIFVVILQVILGIGTLLSYVAIPIALTHQLGALILFSLSLWTIKSLPFVSK